ncbi:MAG: LCP family protein [Acidimicrobiales bacterium]|nr:LCP family protein [Acidimicrobiales bacterium]
MSPGRHRHVPHIHGRRHIPKPRWPRRLLIATNVSVALCLIAAGAAYGYVRFRINSIRTQAAPSLTPVTKGGPTGSAENILLIGNQTRAGLTPAQQAQFGSAEELSGSLSDVIMILHLDPRTHSAGILSIPRDLFTPMPPGSPVGPWQKIDAALNDGTNGPNNLVQAIEADFGIPINHYVELNFNGFQNTVNAIGGINVYFPEPVFDAESLLYIGQPGCVHLDGAQALALVRARHLQYDPPGDTAVRSLWPQEAQSDLARIARDHTFLRILFTAALSQGLGNPLKLNDFLGAIIDQIVIDPRLKGQLLDLASTYKNLNPGTIPELTLPVTPVNNYRYNGYNMGDVDFPVQPLDNQTIAAWDPSALPAPSAPSAVNVYNITNQGHLATSTASGLTANGLPVSVISDATNPGNPSETLVKYAPNALPAALAVMGHLSGAVMLDQDPTVPAGTITVDAGSVLAVTTPAAPASTASTAPPQSTTTPSTSSPTTAVPTAGGTAPSSSSDELQPWDPRPCPAK